MTVLLAALLLIASLAAGCSREPSSGRMDTSSAAPSSSTSPASPASARTAAERDIHSFANPAEARVTHVALDLRADFAAHRLTGRATLDLERAPNAARIVLDTRDLEIRTVADAAGAPLTHTLGDAVPILGRPLTIALRPDTTRLVIDYATRPEAAALQWLAPEQTAGKRHPYLFSQGQAILTRTWIPTQDSPGIRQTYEARVTVPAALRAVMSAEQLTPDGVAVDDPASTTNGGANGGAKGDANGAAGAPDGRLRRFDFRLTQPIPPYLIALAIGDIGFRAVSPRTGVYAEPAVLDRAASEFRDLEKMVQAAESIGGPYRWGRYDLLVLPPSFPFGGMENPRLTFATPTVLAGDRSLTSLVAHELAHSWSGNLVTNATWSDFWLNEGFTVYFELRIMEALYGRERAAMLEALGRRELTDEIARLGPASRDTVLHVDLTGRDPDESVGPVAYEKGAAFLKMLEAAVGRERFDAYLRGYFERHAFTSLTTAAFLADLREHLLARAAASPGAASPDGGAPTKTRALEATLRIDEWLNAPGLPSNATHPASDAFAEVDAQVAAFAGGAPAGSLKVDGWVSQQWQQFVNTLPRTLTPARMTELDERFSFTKQGNSEVLFSWLRLAIARHYTPALPALEHFLTSQGRRKFLKPLYEDLMASGWGQPEAKRIYQRARPLYHAVARTTLDEIVK